MKHGKFYISSALLFSSALVSSFTYADVNIVAPYTQTLPQKNVLTDGKMHIYFCGTGDPQPDMQTLRKPACLAVVADNQFMLFDAGEGSIQTVAGMGLPFRDIDKIFMTHWHSDHFGGLAQVISVSWQQGRKKPLTVYGPYGVEKILKNLKAAYSLDALFRGINRKGALDLSSSYGVPKLVDATKEGKEVYSQGNFKLSAFLVDHSPVFPALGYEIHYKGCKVVISGDTNIASSLAEHAKNADVLINEAFSSAVLESSVEKLKKAGDQAAIKSAEDTIAELEHYHSDTLKLAKMADASKVKNLFITHLVPVMPTTDTAKQSFIAGMSQYYKGPITVTNDRDELVVTSSKEGDCQLTFNPAKQFDIPVIEAN